MRKLFALLPILLISTPAFAEDWIGDIVFTAAASKNNSDTATAFKIGPQRLSVWCDVAVFVCTDRTVCDATKGVPLAANTVFPTWVNGNFPYLTTGTYSYFVAVIPQSGSTGNCHVLRREGKEICG